MNAGLSVAKLSAWRLWMVKLAKLLRPEILRPMSPGANLGTYVPGRVLGNLRPPGADLGTYVPRGFARRVGSATVGSSGQGWRG
jgi:hypothetical protein